jgi:hypothetical protein
MRPIGSASMALSLSHHRGKYLLLTVKGWYNCIGLKKDINRYMFLIFNFDLEYFIRVKSSEPLHTKMNPTSRLLGSRFVWNPFFLLAVALLFVEKIRQSAALF